MHALSSYHLRTLCAEWHDGLCLLLGECHWNPRGLILTIISLVIAVLDLTGRLHSAHPFCERIVPGAPESAATHSAKSDRLRVDVRVLVQRSIYLLVLQMSMERSSTDEVSVITALATVELMNQCTDTMGATEFVLATATILLVHYSNTSIQVACWRHLTRTAQHCTVVTYVLVVDQDQAICCASQA